MTHNIIKTDNYLFVVDDSEIVKGEWYLRYNKFHMKCTELKLTFNEALNKEETIIKSEGCGDPYERSRNNLKKIISHLPLNNSPILEGVDLLPILEDDVSGCEFEFQNGYNKAKETYKYTEKDIDKAYWAGMQFVGEDKGSYKEFIQSLNQPKLPITFECEMVCGNLGCMKMILNGANSACCGDNMKPKTTTNSQGITQWVGTYKYE